MNFTDRTALLSTDATVVACVPFRPIPALRSVCHSSVVLLDAPWLRIACPLLYGAGVIFLWKLVTASIARMPLWSARSRDEAVKLANGSFPPKVAPTAVDPKLPLRHQFGMDCIACSNVRIGSLCALQ